VVNSCWAIPHTGKPRTEWDCIGGFEKRVRELEAGRGFRGGRDRRALCGETELVVEVPADTILDDVFIPMNVVRQRFRVLFDARARAWDRPDLGTQREFSRKVRTLTGKLPTAETGALVVAERESTALRIHKSQAGPAGGSLCIGGVAALDMVSGPPLSTARPFGYRSGSMD